MNEDIKGLLIFYIDVAQLPPKKAEDFLDRQKTKILEGIPFKDENGEDCYNYALAKPLKLPSSVDYLFLMRRNVPNSVEYISYDGSNFTEIQEIKSKLGLSRDS